MTRRRRTSRAEFELYLQVLIALAYITEHPEVISEFGERLKKALGAMLVPSIDNTGCA